MPLSGKKIAGLVILGIIVGGGTYLWITDIAPDIERVSKAHEKIKQENEAIYQERASSFEPFDESNCYYDEKQKVRICN